MNICICVIVYHIFIYTPYIYILSIFQMCIQISLKKRHVSIIYIYYVINIYTQIHMYVTQIPTSAHNLYKTLWIWGKKNMQWNYVFQPLTCGVQRILAIYSSFVFVVFGVFICVYLFFIGIDFPIPNPIPINSLRNLRDLKTLAGGLFVSLFSH